MQGIIVVHGGGVAHNILWLPVVFLWSFAASLLRLWRPRWIPEMFAFSAQKTMYSGEHIVKDETSLQASVRQSSQQLLLS